jgi:Fic family protein
MIPQNAPTRFVVSNAQEELDAMMEQQKIVSRSTTEEFEKLLNGEITADNYVNIADISHSQVNSFIIKIVDSEIPAEWNDSYGAFLEHLRAYNSYLKETIVVANKLKDNQDADISQELKNLEQYLAQADEFLAQSDAARP